MYRTIIWATDGSAEADLALVEAIELARAAGWPALPDEDDRRVKIRTQLTELETQGIETELIVRRTHEDASEAVAEVAAQIDADVIVCGTRATRLGSFTKRLLHEAPCPVLAVPDSVAEMRGVRIG